MLDVRIEPRGPAAEHGVARLCATSEAQRDPFAPLGEPAAVASLADGESVIDLLVDAATMSLGDADVHITVERSAPGPLPDGAVHITAARREPPPAGT